MVPRLDVKISAFSLLDVDISAFPEKIEFLGFSGAAAQRNHRPQACELLVAEHLRRISKILIPPPTHTPHRGSGVTITIA
jgi:hypothetical protein